MTVTVTGFTAARSQAIEDAAIVDGNIVGDDLILVRNDGATANAGNVRGPAGPMVLACTSTTRPSSPTAGMCIWETDTKRFLEWNGTSWRMPWNMPWGWVNGITLQNDIDIAGASPGPNQIIGGSAVAWTAVANRRYLVVVRVRLAADGPVRVTVATENGGGGDIDLQSVYLDNNNALGYSVSWSYHETGIAAGSVTRRLRAAAASGLTNSLHVIGSEGIGTQLHVFDQGPNGVPA